MFPIKEDFALLNMIFTSNLFSKNLWADTLVILNLQCVGRKHYFPGNIYDLIWTSDTTAYSALSLSVRMCAHTRTFLEVPIIASIYHSIIISPKTCVLCFVIEMLHQITHLIFQLTLSVGKTVVTYIKHIKTQKCMEFILSYYVLPMSHH